MKISQLIVKLEEYLKLAGDVQVASVSLEEEFFKFDFDTKPELVEMMPIEEQETIELVCAFLPGKYTEPDKPHLKIVN